jgi:hypothetical protein
LEIFQLLLSLPYSTFIPRREDNCVFLFLFYGHLARGKNSKRKRKKNSNDKEPVVEIGKFVQGLKLVKLEIFGALSKCILYISITLV